MYYVYYLISPIDNRVFYIGKGKGNRMKKHVKLAKKDKISNGNTHLYNKIKSILISNDDVEYQIVYETDNEISAYEKEQELIIEHGLQNLCNMSMGYNIITDEIKYKISSSIKNLYLYDDEYKEKLRKLYDSPEYRLSQSIALKNSLKHKEMMSSSEVISKISDGLKKHYNKLYGEFKNHNLKCCICGFFITVYERESLLSDKYYCSNECRYYLRKTKEYRESMSESIKISKKHKEIYTEEFKKNISDSAKRWWNSLSEEELNEYKLNMSKSLKNSCKHKEKMQSTEYRENISYGLKNSESFKEYNKNRKKRGKYKETEKNKKRRKKSILVNEENKIIHEFNSLKEVCDYFDIKTSTAFTWIKNEKKINGMTLKSV
jgi:hypothetical protein